MTYTSPFQEVKTKRVIDKVMKLKNGHKARALIPRKKYCDSCANKVDGYMVRIEKRNKAVATFCNECFKNKYKAVL